MLGWHLLRDSEILLQERLVEARIHGLEVELALAKTYIAKCEKLIDHERERADAERERADRINDGYLQQNGLPATTVTVRREQEFQAEIAAQKQDKFMKELSEIYGETMTELEIEESILVESQGNA